jgi:hypothetical protein
MKRRQWIQTASAGSVLGAFGLFSGCATPGGAGPKVVVVGGGYGGATAAKYVRMWSDYGIDVTLVEPNAAFVSCPISNLVVGGSKTMADITTPYDNLTRRHGVKVVQDFVTQIDPDKRIVTLASGATLPYDRLIVSPGVDFMPGSAPGMARPGPANLGPAPAIASHARRRCVCHECALGPIPLPPWPLRAGLPSGALLQPSQTQEQGADPGRERRRHLQRPLVQKSLGRSLQGHH